MIFRLLLLFLIVWFLFWLVRKQLTDQTADKPKLKSEQTEDMVPCDYCGTHVPRSLIVQSDNKNYCCKEHAELNEQ